MAKMLGLDVDIIHYACSQHQTLAKHFSMKNCAWIILWSLQNATLMAIKACNGKNLFFVD